MGKIRKGYFSEQNRKASYIETIDDLDGLNCIYKRILEKLKIRPMTMQELAKDLNRESGNISARLNDLRFEYDAVIDTDKSKINSTTKRPNTLWAIAPRLLQEEQLQLF